MTNVYGYNRKTREEDEAILTAVKQHHDFVISQNIPVIMTVLIGSQNYGLDDEKSDIDTMSFAFPTFEMLAKNHEPYRRCYIVDNGHCEVKDIREALNLLKKTSPNSVEYFTSKYKIYNPIYEELLKEYLEDEGLLWYMIHCNYSHMMDAMAGMAHQLTKRNMPAGKQLSHAIRLEDMFFNFFNGTDPKEILSLQSDKQYVLAIKRDKAIENTEKFRAETEQIANKLRGYKDTFVATEGTKQVEKFGMKLIETFQQKLFTKYLMELCKE